MRCYVDMLLNTSTANIKTWERDNGLYGGLSPLTWGTLGIGAIAALCVRFIPAGAGNSVVRSIPWDHLTVYPRWRGELGSDCVPVACPSGLSPLTWGTLTRPGRPRQRWRFIPADVGNSTKQNCIDRVLTVYPRWRGELSKHNLLLINDFLSQSQSTNFTGSHKQHIHYVKEHLIHWLKS